MENIIKNAREIAGKEKLTLFLSEDEIMKKDEEFIRNESYQEGIEQNKISVIHNLVTKKMSLKDISEVVNLPIDEVKKLLIVQKKKRIKPFLFYLLFKFHA